MGLNWKLSSKISWHEGDNAEIGSQGKGQVDGPFNFRKKYKDAGASNMKVTQGKVEWVILLMVQDKDTRRGP